MILVPFLTMHKQEYLKHMYCDENGIIERYCQIILSVLPLAMWISIITVKVMATH